MPYVPKSIPIFQAALAGAFAGMGINAAAGGSATEDEFDNLSPIAGAFAQAVDLAWFATGKSANQYDVEEVQSACQEAWTGRQPANNPTTLLAITWMSEAVTIVNLILAGEDYFASQGITPTPISGGGGGVTAVTATLPVLSSGGDTPNISLEDGTVSGQVIVWNETTHEWEIRQLTEDDILPGFAIDSFVVTPSGLFEVGQDIVNPTFIASYNQVPSAAHVTNTGGLVDPTLTTPFTSGTFTGTLTSDVPASVSATLTATGTSTQSDTDTFATFAYRTFAGTGTVGATSASASGTSAVLNGGAGTLPSEGLFPGGIVGQVFSLTPSADYIYVLTPHTATAHTWKDANTGFSFAMNAPTTFSFTNQYGVVISYDLYQSTNALGGNYGVEAVT